MVVFNTVVRVPGALGSVLRRVVVVVLPALPKGLDVAVLRAVAVICLFAVSFICFSVSADFGEGLLIGFGRAIGAVVGLGFGAAFVVALGEVSDVVLVVLFVAVTEDETVDLVVLLVVLVLVDKVVGLVDVVVCRTVVDLAGAVAGLVVPVDVLFSVFVGLNLLGTGLVAVLLVVDNGTFLAVKAAGFTSPFVNVFFSAALAVAVIGVLGLGDGLAALGGSLGVVDVLAPRLTLCVAVVVVLVAGSLAPVFGGAVLVGDAAGLAAGFFVPAAPALGFTSGLEMHGFFVATAAAVAATATAATATNPISDMSSFKFCKFCASTTGSFWIKSSALLSSDGVVIVCTGYSGAIISDLMSTSTLGNGISGRIG